MKFANPSYLPLLLSLPALLGLCLFYERWRKKAYKEWVTSDLERQITPKIGYTARWTSYVFLFMALASFFLALARPQWGKKAAKQTQKGLDIAILLDVSMSMKLNDLQPSRWERTVQELQLFLGRLRGDRVALIAFGREAGLQCPLTADTIAIQKLAWVSRPGSMSDKGEGLADAFSIAHRVLFRKRSKNRSKVVLLLSDGEQSARSTSLDENVRKLRASGAYLFTIGTGESKRPQGLSSQAGITWTALDTAYLQRITGKMSGSYLTLPQAGVGLKRLIASMKTLQREQFGSQNKKRYIDRFPIFLAFGLVCFGLFVAFER